MPITSKAITETSLGTGTTKTQLTGADIKVPAWARTLLAVEVVIYPLTPKANISYNAKFYLESDDIPSINPFIALAPPVGAGDATQISSVVPKKAHYIVNCPVTGGENLQVWGEMLTGDGTANVYMGGNLIFGSEGALLPSSIDPLRGKHRHAKVGTWTACGANALKAGTAYEIIGGKAIVEAMGIVNNFTVASSKPSSGDFRLESSGFGITPLSFFSEVAGAVLTGGADVQTYAKLTRLKNINVPIASHITIQDYLNSGAGTVVTDYFITGVVYI